MQGPGVHTHLAISGELVGVVEERSAGRAVCSLRTLPVMAADHRGLVHGGFVFGLADYAAMVAVNDPHVVLGAAEARFTAPVRVGELVRAVAELTGEKGRKREVRVVASTGTPGEPGAGVEVFIGTFTTFVLDGHVLDR